MIFRRMPSTWSSTLEYSNDVAKSCESDSVLEPIWAPDKICLLCRRRKLDSRDTIIGTIKFSGNNPGPYLYEFALLAKTLNAEEKTYRRLSTNCSSVTTILCQLVNAQFKKTPGLTDPEKARGKFNGILIVKPIEENAVNNLLSQYDQNVQHFWEEIHASRKERSDAARAEGKAEGKAEMRAMVAAEMAAVRTEAREAAREEAAREALRAEAMETATEALRE
ncbi:hypothetical protein Hypma_012518 [Hypsizygus marmoreus]|uniref:Uncharacterized protein n=1 Tax=Hypsizygus marmoreus TaxID=39966 RepID=A0A369JGI8_HYPMA|nr:hypothetical protein Hypma_012518 [Hypsizygus marmoreus]